MNLTSAKPEPSMPESTESPGSEHITVFADAVRRVRAEFLEMPGLRLTAAQAARLWAFDAAFCNEVLASLVNARFLVCTRGAFVRATEA